MTLDEQLIKAMGDKVGDIDVDLLELDAQRVRLEEQLQGISDSIHQKHALRRGLLDALFALGSAYQAVTA